MTLPVESLVGCEQLLLAAPGASGALDSGAKRLWNRTPEDAVELLAMMVLLTMFTASASWREMPPPSHPATLLLMMLLLTSTEFQAVAVWKAGCAGRGVTVTPAGCGSTGMVGQPGLVVPVGKLTTSFPL